MTKKPPLPSAVFLALVPDDGVRSSDRRVMDIGQMIGAGLWPFDPAEVDPRTGWNIVQALVRQSSMDVDAKSRALELVVGKGADINFVAPDGLTAHAWIALEGDRFLQAELERLGATVPAGRLTATQQEVVEALQDVARTWQGGESLVNKALSESGFGSLDVSVKGIPLGLHIVWKKMAINGALLAEDPGELARAMSVINGLGKAASRTQPQSDFALWCWLAQNQGSAWAPSDASPTQKKKWQAQCLSLEKALVRARYKGVPLPEANRQLALDAARVVEKTMRSLATAPKFEKKLQALAALFLSSMREWVDAAGGSENESIASARRQALWESAARLARAVPLQRWEQPRFSEAWASAAYYAMCPDIRLARATGKPLPGFVSSSHVTLPPLIQSNPGARELDLECFLPWLSQSRPTQEDRDLALAMLSHNPEAAAALRQHWLSQSLDAPVPAPQRVRM